MEAEKRYNLCYTAVQVCAIYEDYSEDVRLTAEVITNLNDQQIDLRLKDNIYDIDDDYINTEMLKRFLTTTPVIHCKVQKTVTVVSQNNPDISDAFANMNFNDEVPNENDTTDFSDNDSSDRDFSGTFHSTNAGPSNEDNFNSGNYAAYTPNDNPGNSNVDPFVVTSYTSTNVEIDFLVFILNDAETDAIYPMFIFLSKENYYYPAYQIY